MQKNKPFLFAKYYLVDSNLNRIKSDWVTSSIMTWLQDKKKSLSRRITTIFHAPLNLDAPQLWNKKRQDEYLLRDDSTFDNSSVSRLPAVKQETFQLPTTKSVCWSFTDRLHKGGSHRHRLDFTVSITSPASYPAVLASIFRSQAALISKRLYKWTYLTLKQVESFHIVLIGLHYSPKNKGSKIGVS